MARKSKEIKIENVNYIYVGTDKDFNLFLKSVIHDYLNGDKKEPVVIDKVEDSET